MKQYIIIKTLLILLFLSGCGETEQQVDFSEQPEAVLSYSSPSDNQQSVPVDSGIILTFTHDITDETLLDHVQLLDEAGNPVSITVELHPANSKMVTVIPNENLEAGKSYRVDFSKVLSEIGIIAGEGRISFSTLNTVNQPSGNDGDDQGGDDQGGDDQGGDDQGGDDQGGDDQGGDDQGGDDQGGDDQGGDDQGGDDQGGDDQGGDDQGGDDQGGDDQGGDDQGGDDQGGDDQGGDDQGGDDSNDPGEIGPVDFSDINEVLGVEWPAFNSDVFQVMHHFPAGNLPFVDFSTLHFTLSHEVDSATVVLNDSFKFVKEGDVDSVPGQLLIKGKSISFDPTDDLEAGVSYTLTLTSAIKSVQGKPLTTAQYADMNWVPHSSYPRLGLVQKIKGEEGGPSSPVNGLTRNSVLVDSKLIGQSMSYADGDYHVELANLGSFIDSMPFIIRKGSVIRMSSMDVNIGGAIPAGYETETLFLTLTTDAVGYLTENDILTPHKKRRLTMLMDTSMIAENPKANGALSQDLLNVTLTGIAGFSGSILTVDAVGDIQVELLGLETASSTATFFLEAYADQDNAPMKEIDSSKPVLQHWIPGDHVDRFQLSDSILLTFNEGLATHNLTDEIQLTKASGEIIETRIRQDGSVVIIDPETLLEAGTDYEVHVSNFVTDMAGNSIDQPMVLSFTTQVVDQQALAAPVLSSVYPGYNCRFTDPDYGNDIAGRCSGGLESDDKFTIFTLPSNRNIHIEFSQPMDLATIELGTECGAGNFRVEKIDESRNCLAGVDGSLDMSAKGFTFTPTEGWEEGTLYRYTLYSAKESSCNGADNVPCSIYGLPLNPKPLKIKNENRWEGGNSIHMPFRVTAAEETYVFNPLRQVPTADVNRNFLLDSSETVITQNASKLAVGGTTGLVQQAVLGCREGSCDAQKAIYVSGSIPTDVGQYDEVNQRIPVYMYPQALMTTTVTMYAKTILGWLENPTGPQVMRMRPNYDENGKSVPTVGYITWDESTQQAIITTTMNVYLDAPGLAPKILGLELHTNMHSLPLTIELQGPVKFMEDGRMEITLSNQQTVDIDVVIESFLGDSDVFLKIPKGELSINMVSKMTKQ